MCEARYWVVTICSSAILATTIPTEHFNFNFLLQEKYNEINTVKNEGYKPLFRHRLRLVLTKTA